MEIATKLLSRVDVQFRHYLASIERSNCTRCCTSATADANFTTEEPGRARRSGYMMHVCCCRCCSLQSIARRKLPAKSTASVCIDAQILTESAFFQRCASLPDLSSISYLPTCCGFTTVNQSVAALAASRFRHSITSLTHSRNFSKKNTLLLWLCGSPVEAFLPRLCNEP